MVPIKLACMSVCLAVIQSPLSDVKRLAEQPILAPRANQIDSKGAFNPASVKYGGKTILLYRAQDDKGTSRVGYAESVDGLHFSVKEPVLTPQEPYEKDGGVEDPRLVEINGQYYLTYTGYNGKDAQLCLAVSRDLRNWKRLGVILPAYKGTWNKQRTKSGAIVTKKIKGKYWMYYLGTADGADQMGLATSTDLVHWADFTEKPVLPRRQGMFDSKVVEPGPPPILTSSGILLIYNGGDDNLVYRTGWVLFDKDDPSKVLARSDKPIFQPEREWEKVGQVPNVVFVEGLVREGDRFVLYYGGADANTGVAECKLLREAGSR